MRYPGTNSSRETQEVYGIDQEVYAIDQEVYAIDQEVYAIDPSRSR